MPSNARIASPIAITLQPPAKKQRREPVNYPTITALPADLGKCVKRDSEEIRELGWEEFVRRRRGRGDLGDLNFDHPAKRLLKEYKTKGAPVKLKTEPWTKHRVERAMDRGAHKSCSEYLPFLQQEFVEMIEKNQWVILPFEDAKELVGLRISPPGCVPQRDRRPRWICDYSFYDVNQETIELFAEDAMQFGHALERFLRQILLADPALGPVLIMKLDISDGFYRICLNPNDIPKLGVVFPTLPGQQRLVAFPLVLPMGWKNSPPIFSTATETIADLANKHINDASHHPVPHPLSTLASTFESYNANPLSPTLSTVESNSYHVPSSPSPSTNPHPITITPASNPTDIQQHHRTKHLLYHPLL